MMEFDLLNFESDIPSYNQFANYLCKEVFTDMSVLPLVFPSNISCFSRGSYKEELARKRELPVPPEPRRTGILARSDDNLAGNYENLLSSLSYSMTDTCSTLTRHSSYTWLRDEEEDTCLLATQLRRRYEEVRRSAMEHGGVGDILAEEPECCFSSEQLPQLEPVSVWPGHCSSDDRTVEEITDNPSDEIEDVISGSDVITCPNSDKMEEKDNSNDKMSVFKKKEKTSLFQRTIDRLSFKSRKKREKDKTFTVEVLQGSKSSAEKSEDDKFEQEIQKLEESPKISPRYATSQAPVTPSKSPPSSLMLSPSPAPPLSSSTPRTSTPTSARYLQSRPITQLDQALKSFKRDTAKSRENLSVSRPDLSEAISVFTSRCNTPRAELKSFDRTPRSTAASTAPPAAASSRWRQVAPSSNKYVESEWAKLSASMMNLSGGRSRTDLTSTSESHWRETNLSSSNMSLDIRGLEADPDNNDRGRMDRAMSVNVLSSVDHKDDIRTTIPDNSLRDMNTYQKRIQASMEKLNVPTWYKSSSSNTTAPPTPTPTLRPPSKSSTLPSFTSSWRTASLSTQAGWRRQNPPLSSSISSAASTLDRQSCLVTSQRFRNKVSTLPSSSSANNLLPNKVYLGWRSQERLDIGPLYLTSPAQRLATSAVVVKEKPAKNEEQVKEDIKEVTEAIIDYCNSPVNGKPVQVKQAWMINDEDSDNSDNPDDDSGIDRSDDFTQEILNEA